MHKVIWTPSSFTTPFLLDSLGRSCPDPSIYRSTVAFLRHFYLTILPLLHMLIFHSGSSCFTLLSYGEQSIDSRGRQTFSIQIQREVFFFLDLFQPWRSCFGPITVEGFYTALPILPTGSLVP